MMKKLRTIARLLQNGLLPAVCSIVGHRYKVTRRVARSIYELQCPRCKARFGMNTSVKALLPLNLELQELHSELSAEDGR